jgi:hypothetical protein
MKKNAVAKALADMPGFIKRGSFYVGTCNDSVIAGYSLDAPPSAVYVWRFLIPAYDNVEFLHMSLGKRILTLPQSSEEGIVELSESVQRDWSDFSKVTDCGSLIKYLDVEQLASPYALWVRYLTHIQCKEFDAAERLNADASVAKKLSELQAISKSLAELSEVRSSGGWESCSALLDEWRRKTKAAFC